MQRPKPNKLQDELDALLDGRPVELTDELAPLVEAADSLRAELEAFRLDPKVADRHLERALERSGTVVQLPVRQPSGGWDVRRRVVAVALAAALVLAPATIASAAALPGQAMYPFKLAIEQVRLASVQWSPGRVAVERTRVADERLDEVQSLFRLQMFTQLPGALRALEQAVVAAEAAVAEAKEEGEPFTKAETQLTQVRAGGGQVVEDVWVAAASGSIPLTGDTRQAVQAAVEQSRDVLPPPSREAVPTTGSPNPPQATAGNPPNTPPSDPTGPPTTNPPTTDPPTTSPPTTDPPTTNPPTTDPPTTNPPTSATPESPEGQTDGGSGLAGSDGKSAVPPTTLAP